MPRGLSYSTPPRYVEYERAEPAAFSLNTKPSVTSVAQRGQFGGMLIVRSNAPPVVGKFEDFVVPVTYALPAASTASRRASSRLLPPTNVEYTSPEPAALSLVTKTSLKFEVAPVRSKAPVVVGKSGDCVVPATNAFPAALTAIPVPISWLLPPRKVVYWTPGSMMSSRSAW